jgi:hypothetical protein
MKIEIYNQIELLENSLNEVEKRKGRTIRLFANAIHCFKCIGARRSWKDRDNLPWSAFDGRGYYDIIGCTECNNCGWITCSYTNDCIENEIRIYHKDNYDWKDRIEQLYNKASKDKHIVEEVNLWLEPQPVLPQPLKVVEEIKSESNPLFEVCKRVNRDYIEKSLDIEVEIGKIIDIVKDTVEAYFGNVFSLVDLCKELKVSFSISDTQSVSYDKLTKIKDNNYLGIKTCTKVTQNKIKTGLFGKNSFAKEYSADIFILKPINKAAVEKSIFIMGKINTDMTDDILKDF